MFTQIPKESNNYVTNEPLEMTILDPCVKISPGRLTLIVTLDVAKLASLRLERYSLGPF